jgi:hypothetical protein
MALLDRELPLTSLADYADEARRGDGRVVLVSGEAAPRWPGGRPSSLAHIGRPPRSSSGRCA